jgi:hypothetical protein
LVDDGLQTFLPVVGVFVDLQDGVGAWSTMGAGALEGSRIDEKDTADPVTDRVVGMTIDDAVGRGEHGPDPFFDGVPRFPGAVTQPDAVPIHRDQLAVRQELLASYIAHITMDCVDFLAVKSLKDGDVGEVSGVEDHGTVCKNGFDLSAEGI